MKIILIFVSVSDVDNLILRAVSERAREGGIILILFYNFKSFG